MSSLFHFKKLLNIEKKFQNSLRSVYEHLRAVEMKRVDSAAKDTGNRTIAAVSLQLQDFLKARIELIELYNQFCLIVPN
jgi:hypothetical protein